MGICAVDIFATPVFIESEKKITQLFDIPFCLEHVTLRNESLQTPHSFRKNEGLSNWKYVIRQPF